MNRDNFFKKLGDNKFLEGRPEQMKDWNQSFSIRRDNVGFYISPREKKQNLSGGHYETISEARAFIETNWQELVDKMFEDEVLFGTERSTADDSTED